LSVTLNDRSFGVKRYVFPRVGMTRLDYQTVVREPTIYTTTDLHLTWDVPYEPGTLRAVGRNGDEIVCIDEAVTAGEPSAISLSADRHTINADGRDVVHITVRILDQDGNLVPVADNTVEFEVEGCGKLIGVDNGNPTSHEDFQASYRKAFFGLCLAIVRASTVPGPIQITATSDGLRSDSVAVTAEAISV